MWITITLIFLNILIVGALLFIISGLDSAPKFQIPDEEQINKPSELTEIKTSQDKGTTDKRPSDVRDQSVGYQTTLPQNDLMLNIVANPTFSLEEFVAIRINKDNVSLKDIQIYREDPYIRSMFTDELGNLNEMRLQSVYHKATEWLKRLNNPTEDLSYKPSFHRDNIFAPSEQRRKGPDYEELIKTPK